MIELEADYVIIGSGAIGMAFADVIIHESDASIIMIDRYAKPGGHWNAAYPFVRLHQPATFYGVSSKELSGGRSEQGGLNDGLGELSSGPEILAYYDDIMRHDYLPSGRVQYFPMCDYQGGGTFVSKVSGQTYHARAQRKYVDATHLKANVPSTHKPAFEIAENVDFMPLNDLPKIKSPYDNYTVIGAGKTGIDACLWLLAHHVDPDNITWVVNRDAWLIDRQNTQMHESFFFDTIGSFAAQMESIAQAKSPRDMFDRLEQSGYFLRIDEDTRPQMFKGATISKAEIAQLQRIKHVVRKGHVTSIARGHVHLTKGELKTKGHTLYIDCSASAVLNTELKPIYSGDTITPQMVRPYQPVFSAAFIAHIELNFDNEREMNRLCMPLCLPNTLQDYMDFTLGSLLNQREWAKHGHLKDWINNNRLDGASNLIKSIKDTDTDKIAVMMRIKESAPLAAMKLMTFKQQNS